MSLDAPYKAQARPGVAVLRSAAPDFHLWLICLNNSGASGAFTHGGLPGQSRANAPLLIAGVHVGALTGLRRRRVAAPHPSIFTRRLVSRGRSQPSPHHR